ncbi:relaxase/mobilization nuclease domain-containing protein [Mucilaginibacter rubeus]|uniref:Relaxase/mobilization nuclease domain-containing protein n=1 Tax=Mucilaginibacter rubeus TaxID=2027860 RepID=A0AAE6JGD6_9SPHI|nr:MULTISPECIES: relaxase/mobilization nuclease domain-containing protein [Mucilaginibacter]QEM04936.1 relaxase/mobilization nuclease domain-containing protein [Mucilaginibacter rubeus]QEM17530.1 relaxase/mobilization nuclease domain-containing protein [Mucilaginibacter gossypii]QTE45949.1 relaxase/mobilization nuclease domain-containing protein [Mucilaginibacter rubeus]QTE52546.1 relaxase/mobilization nuclease domain-containing protein [Mucilaginibacter rubeus]QTE57635.1 relaxase/mobilization
MIVKILYTSGPNGHFPAISYNTGKMDKNKGELMRVANFGPLQRLGLLRPSDYRQYLRMVSATNKAVTKPQFHVAISAEGKSYNKQEITDFATQWLERMGYGKQPYLIIFHSDTLNNHVHIVSTRVDKQGKKIRDSFEQIRGQEQMNIILGINEKHNTQRDISKALEYQFATKAQFMMLLECRGYVLKEAGQVMQVIKFGKQQGEVSIAAIEERQKEYAPNEKRRVQLKALFHKYAVLHDTGLTKNRTVYTSAFSVVLKEKFGIELLYHASVDKAPYGYTVIDHDKKQVFKGGEIVPLKELLAIKAVSNKKPSDTSIESNKAFKFLTTEKKEFYSSILKAVLHNYPDMMQGLQHQGLMIYRKGESFYLHDPGAGLYAGLDKLLNESDYNLVVENFSQAQETSEELYRQHHHFSGINLASDVDDEAILGMKRRRKQKARTNLR